MELIDLQCNNELKRIFETSKSKIDLYNIYVTKEKCSNLTLSECYIWFVHHILSVYQKSILMWEKKIYTTDVFDTMNDLGNQI